MLELLLLIGFLWLLGKTVGLAFRLTWGLARIAVSLLLALALPMLVLCLVFAGGLLLLIPVGAALLAFCIARACLV